MGRINPKDPFVYFHRGVASRFTRDGSKVPVEKMIYNDPECGYYIHPDGYIVLPDFNPVSGDIDRKVALMVVDGSLTIMTLADAAEAVCTYKTNAAPSATSVTITGCLVGTNLTVGATRQLTATVLPLGAIQTGDWTSSNTAKATVNSSGLVTAIAAGTSTITFTSTDGGFTATCAIVVVAP
jgi:uncharacterized protein YjdB